MILVTGTGRCGTSLMMQTLYHLGVPLIGNPQDDNNTHCQWGSYDIVVSEELNKKTKEFNPKGYWELALNTIVDVCQKGFKESYTGQAIKIVGALVTIINTQDIEKVIICKRKNRTRQAESMYDLAQVLSLIHI